MDKFDIKIKKLNYSEFTENDQLNSWSLDDLTLNTENLIVGKNATGKTRTLSVIRSLAFVISQRSLVSNGNWHAEFEIRKDNKKSVLVYDLILNNQKVKKESLFLDDKPKLLRNEKESNLYSENEKKTIKIDPPDEKLVLHVRRDKTDFNFFEYLINWAMDLKAFSFGNTNVNTVDVPVNINDANNLLNTLNSVPSVLDNLKQDTVKKIIDEFNSLEYNVEDARANVNPQMLPYQGPKMLQIKEKGLPQYINQTDLSQGMYRAFALLVLLQYLIDNKIQATVLVDDLCDGLDYVRATKITKLIYTKTKNANIQFIASTNDSHLMNAVDLKKWNILNKINGNHVVAYNYANNSEVFDEFRTLGLNNFDIFTSDALAKLAKK